jgi:hypothetical protein
MTQVKLIGLALGLWLGFVWMAWSFSDMVLVALAGLVGYGVGALVAGDVDVERFIGPLTGRASRGR